MRNSSRRTCHDGPCVPLLQRHSEQAHVVAKHAAHVGASEGAQGGVVVGGACTGAQQEGAVGKLFGKSMRCDADSTRALSACKKHALQGEIMKCSAPTCIHQRLLGDLQQQARLRVQRSCLGPAEPEGSSVKAVHTLRRWAQCE